MRFSPQMRDLSWLVARPIAHRGRHDWKNGLVENSQSAFAAAISGNYAIECDLQITREGEAVVFHDETLDRVMQAKGWVNQHSVAELKALSYRHGKDRIQTLAEMLTQVAGKVPLVIELKSHWNGDEALALRALKVLEPYDGPYALMSFDPDVIATVATYSPQTVRGIVADRVVDSYYAGLSFDRRMEMRHFSHLSRTRPHFVSFNYMELPFQPVQNIRAAGHPVISWTIHSQAAANQARRYSDQITFEDFAA